MEIPHVVRFDTFPLNLEDNIRFKLSRWNYFIKDQANKYVAGFWEAEEGEEHIGTDEFDELMLVLKGTIHVIHDSTAEKAGPGDCIYVRAGRPVTLRIEEKIQSFFYCIPMNDIKGYEDMVLDKNTGALDKEKE